MAAIALTTSGRVEVVHANDQTTAICAVAVTAGQPVYIGTAGKWVAATGADAAHSTGIHIAAKAAAIGEALTALRAGLMDGYAVSAMAYNDPIYISDAGTLATTAGTVSVVIGRVTVGTATALGSSADKLVRIQCPL